MTVLIKYNWHTVHVERLNLHSVIEKSIEQNAEEYSTKRKAQPTDLEYHDRYQPWGG